MDITIMIIALVMFIGVVVSWFLLPGTVGSTTTITEAEPVTSGVTA